MAGLAGAILLAFLQPSTASAASVVISEFMAQNTKTLADETGRYPDWIELHNVTSAAINLDGWYLTDTTNNLSQWRIPAVMLPANGYLVIFASGRDQTNAAAPLHTNFQLNNNGEYLALVRPDGQTIESRFYPTFPEQFKDISYGSGETNVVSKLIAAGATARVRVPRDDALGTNWLAPGFNDSAWTAGPTGLGYSTNTVTGLYAYWPLNEGTGTSAAKVGPGGATATLNGATWVNDATRGMVLSFNGSGNYASAGTIPAMGQTTSNFTWALWCKLISVPAVNGVILGNRYGGTASPLQFIKFTPSNFEFYNANAPILLAYTVPVGQWVHLAAVKNGSALTYYANGAVVGSGTATANIDPNPFYLGGDPGGEYANCLLDDVALWSSALSASQVAALVAGTSPVALGGYGGVVGTDLRGTMMNSNATAYARLPFAVTENQSFNVLRLRMMYDDGFVAWLNGVEVARRNAPATPVWNSTATAEHPINLATVFEDIDITGALPLVQVGTNVLAIQGLNLSAADGDFLLLPELEGVSVEGLGERYFGTPTPGQPNNLGVLGYVADTKFSHDRGFYDTNFALTISCATPGVTIRYTLNGTYPGETNGLIYSTPIPITNTTTLRAAAYRPGWQPAPADAQSYLFMETILKQTGAGSPALWGSAAADYAMDPYVVTNARYAPTIRNDLKSLPVLSIVMDPADLFTGTGIYANPTSRGPAWEKACSVEYFFPDGSQKGFQVNCGIRLHGGASRDPNQSPKHSFNLLFKTLFGASKLNYKLFPDSEVDSFNNLVLRANFNYTWVRHDGDGPIGNPNGIERTHTQYTRDKFAKDLQMSLGQAGSHETVTHLYINGLYWGTYNPCERTDSAFAASYYGGDRTNYDTIFNDSSGVPVANDGDRNAWNTMLAIANAGITNEAAYAALKQYCDVTNLVDYMLLNFYLQTLDWPWQNWNALRRRDPAGLFMFYVWDAEYILEDVNGDRTGVGAGGNEVDSPARFYNQLRNYSEFRLLFADRIQRHMFNNGKLTPAALTNAYRWQADLVDRSIVAESARWGDVRRTPAYTHDVEWLTERDRLLNSWLVPRCSVVLQQLRTAGLYPTTVGAPIFNPYGGPIAGSLPVTLSTTNGTMYWTTNGDDPRVYAVGTVAPAARAYTVPLTFSNSVRLKARTLSGGVWSALTEAVYLTTNLSALRLTELMVNPTVPPGSTNSPDDFEFVELHNTGDTPLPLDGYSFDRGITFTFSNGTVLAPHQYLVVVADLPAFTSRYGSGRPVAGQYLGHLADGGEAVRLVGAFGETVQEFSYQNWYPLADGLGFSLVITDVSAPAALWSDRAAWRPSGRLGGSPGAADLPVAWPTVLVNEVLANPIAPDLQLIELYNPNPTDVDVGGWFLTDDRMVPQKYRIPDGTAIDAGSYLVVNEAQFHLPATALEPFGLSPSGEEVFLYSGDSATNLTGYTHGFVFNASAPGVSFGRYVNSGGEEQFPAQITTSFSAANAGPRVGPVVIQEIYYAAPTNIDKFIELRNLTDAPLPLFDTAHPSNTWRVSGLGFDFPTNLTMPAQGLIVLTGGEPEAFRSRWAVPAGVLVFSYSGGLQDNGENLELQRPAPPTGNNLDYITVDAVRYHNVEPWPPAAAGLGASLQKYAPQTYGNEPTNWTGALPSPGRDLPAGAAPLITVPPADTYVVAYQDTQLSAEAAGDPPLAYQWRFAGTNLPGATNLVLPLPNVQPSQAGAYALMVFNASGSALSPSATLTVGIPPTITQQPANVNANPGATVTFSVVATGTGPLTYQWRFYGTNLPGATGSILSLPNVQLGQSGPYSVVVTDSIGPRLSQPGILVVLVKPVPTVPPPHFLAIPGETVSFTASAYGSLPMGARWRKNSGSYVDYVTLPGNVATLTLSNLSMTNAGAYSAVFTNYAAPNPTTKEESPKGYLSMVRPPLNQLAELGATATFRTPVNGQVLRYYAWEFNGTALLRGTNTAGVPTVTNALVITNMQPEKVGTYSYLITNIALYYVTNGSVITTNWTNLGSPRAFTAMLGIGIQVDPPSIDVDPTNRTGLAGTNLSFVVVASGGAPLRYQWFFNTTNLLAGQTNATLALTNVQAPDIGGYSVVVTNTGGVATSQVAQLTVLLPPSIDAQPADVVRPPGAAAGFSVSATGSGSLRYQWYKGTNLLAGQTNTLLVLINVQATNAGGYKVVITNLYGTLTSRVAQLLVGVVPSIVSEPSDLTLPVGASASFSVQAAGDAPLAYQWYQGSTPLLSQTNPSLSLDNVQAAQAGGYQVVITNAVGAVTSRVAVLTVGGGAPAIDQQPADATAVIGASATFTVTAHGAGSLTYQWYHGTVLLEGMTAPALDLANVQPAQAGGYQVIVANTGGSVTSRVAVLTVLIAPTITLQPTNLVVAPGQDATLVVTAAGTDPLSYQWWFNAANALAGQTTSNLTLHNVQAAQVGSYRVVVTNQAGTATSQAAQLVLTTTDTDGDGAPDWAEWIAGTDPLDASSYLKVDQIAPGENQVTLRFLAVSNHTYSVVFRTETPPGSWSVLTNVAALPTNREVQITNSISGADRRFFRLATPQLP